MLRNHLSDYVIYIKFIYRKHVSKFSWRRFRVRICRLHLAVVFISASSLVSIRYEELCHRVVSKHVQEQVVGGEFLKL